MKQKVYLIVETSTPKVYARVFETQEKAKQAINERDHRTGERIYPHPCHVVERIIE